MNDLNRANADAILRTLYNLSPNEMREYWLVLQANEIPKDEGERIQRYIDSRGFLQVHGKVGNGDVYVSLSKGGIRFFSDDCLVDEYKRNFNPPAAPVQTFHIKGNAANFGNNNNGNTINTATQIDGQEQREEKWYSKFMHDTGTQIASGLAVSAILALIAWYFSQPK